MEFEVSTELDARRLGSDSMQAFLNERAAAQTTEGQPCPKCGKRCRVRRKWVQRKVQSLHGEHVLKRHYHYCARCKEGWFPLDRELSLPDEGELTPRMEQVVLDLGLHSPFEEAAQRFAVHHGGEISENLVRRVVERVGRRAEACVDLAARLRAEANAPPSTLLVQVDGSMLSTVPSLVRFPAEQRFV